jgi:hypothetical protein
MRPYSRLVIAKCGLVDNYYQKGVLVRVQNSAELIDASTAFLRFFA